eukprot:TRINITY_DN31694_c0_g1_i1.p1 TRINITY_DN31694_c0_g1~~TRINITY_DN31694_c0_g1_i1.p1  ORF type:complete len:149 (+),score=19.95 TRINITY_DN31694_c0_g1_i1:228-674(+)
MYDKYYTRARVEWRRATPEEAARPRTSVTETSAKTSRSSTLLPETLVEMRGLLEEQLAELQQLSLKQAARVEETTKLAVEAEQAERRFHEGLRLLEAGEVSGKVASGYAAPLSATVDGSARCDPPADHTDRDTLQRQEVTDSSKLVCL